MRLFVAVWPSPSVALQLAALDRPPRAGVRWTTEDQWHVTLRFLGQILDEDLQRVKGALSALESVGPTRPVTAVAGPALTRLGPSVLCVPVAGLDGLAASVVRATAEFGEPPDERPFRGHITVARAARHVKLRLSAPVPFEGSWEVEEVTLVASVLHRAGARYEVVGRYPLAVAG
jgi:2'-5' RNA ligase